MGTTHCIWLGFLPPPLVGLLGCDPSPLPQCASARASYVCLGKVPFFGCAPYIYTPAYPYHTLSCCCSPGLELGAFLHGRNLCRYHRVPVQVSNGKHIQGSFLRESMWRLVYSVTYCRRQLFQAGLLACGVRSFLPLTDSPSGSQCFLFNFAHSMR